MRERQCEREGREGREGDENGERGRGMKKGGGEREEREGV